MRFWCQLKGLTQPTGLQEHWLDVSRKGWKTLHDGSRQWSRPLHIVALRRQGPGQVDRRSVVNPRPLLEAVRARQPSWPRLVAFFAVMPTQGSARRKPSTCAG
jgi:hypothetical protein